MSDLDHLPQVMREAITRRREREAKQRDSMAEAHDNAVEASRYDIEQFEDAAGMSAAFFCKFVRRRQWEGADFATIALELDDPRRSISFTAESVESIHRDLMEDLSVDNDYWLDETPAAPAIPPKGPIKVEPKVVEVDAENEHPVGIPYIKLKTWDSSSPSGLARRIAGHVVTRSGKVVPGPERDSENDPGASPSPR